MFIGNFIMKENGVIKISENVAELVGIILGDGCISINNRYSELALCGDITEEKPYYENYVVPLLNRCLKSILKNKIEGKEVVSNGVYGVHIFDEGVVNCLLELGLKKSPKVDIVIPKRFISNRFLKHTLRGLFDTDGSIYFEKNLEGKHTIPKIKLGSTSKKLVNQLAKILKNLNFKPYLPKPYKGKRDMRKMYYIRLSRREDVERWIEFIGFNSSKHLTKIELWRKTGICPPYTTLALRKEMIKKVYKSNKCKLFYAGVSESGKRAGSFSWEENLGKEVLNLSSG